MDLDKRESHDAVGWDEELWKNAMDDSDPDYYWSFINQENKVINVFLFSTYLRASSSLLLYTNINRIRTFKKLIVSKTL